MKEEYVIIMSNSDKYHIEYPVKYGLTFLDMVKNVIGLILVEDVLLGNIYLNPNQICSVEKIKQ